MNLDTFFAILFCVLFLAAMAWNTYLDRRDRAWARALSETQKALDAVTMALARTNEENLNLRSQMKKDRMAHLTEMFRLRRDSEADISRTLGEIERGANHE